MKRDYLNWITKNIMILFLMVLIVILVILKIFFRVDSDSNNSTNVLEPTPTPTIISGDKIGTKTKTEIRNMSEDQYSSFLDTLTEEEFLSLPPTKYNLVDFVAHEEDLFKVESYTGGKLIVKLKSEDKNKAVEALNSWLYSDTGNDPKSVMVVWQ